MDGVRGLVRADTEADYAQRHRSVDGLVRDYRKRELADPSFARLTPWCEAGKLLPEQHTRQEIDLVALQRHAKFDVCPGCAEERRMAREGRPS
ncbi:hypothetical protein [Amycolatopsis sp. NBC_00438]|uniref:hypothetical protein n=1 Tax=Amycolatopsis sp. NBC_00438 TaxID=2903558 RepID=UPI002E231CDE